MAGEWEDVQTAHHALFLRDGRPANAPDAEGPNSNGRNFHPACAPHRAGRLRWVWVWVWVKVRVWVKVKVTVKVKVIWGIYLRFRAV